MSRHKTPAHERILMRIQVTASGCWEFTGARSNGYGHVRVDGRAVLVHRVMYEFAVAPIPDGLVIDHLCRNKACCNPQHLEPVTYSVNYLRGDRSSTEGYRAQLERAKTECPYGHEYDEANTYITRRGHRQCRKCKARRQSELYKRNQTKEGIPA